MSYNLSIPIELLNTANQMRIDLLQKMSEFFPFDPSEYIKPSEIHNRILGNRVFVIAVYHRLSGVSHWIAALTLKGFALTSDDVTWRSGPTNYQLAYNDVYRYAKYINKQLEKGREFDLKWTDGVYDLDPWIYENECCECYGILDWRSAIFSRERNRHCCKECA